MKKTVSLVLAVLLALLAMPAFAEDAAAPFGKGATIDVALLHTTTMVSDVVDNEFTKWMEEKTGVHLNINPIAAEVADDKLNLMLNTSDYPEMFLMYMSLNNIQRYGVEEGILVPITSLIKDKGVNYNKVASRYPAILSDLTMSNDEIYGMIGPQRPFHGMEQSGKLYLNTTWLGKVGMAVPTTTEEFANVLRAFKTTDLNENGKADEIPMSGSNSWNGFPHEMLMNAFCHYNNGRIEMFKDGAFVPQYEQDGFKEGLAYVAQLYSEGLIDPAAYTQTDAMLTGLVDNETAMVGAMNLGHLYMSQAMGSPVNKDWEMLLPLTGPKEYKGVPYNNTIGVGGAYVTFTNKCKDLDLAFTWADYLFSDDASIRTMWGIQGKHWDYIKEPGKTMLDEDAEFELLDNPHAIISNFRWVVQGLGQNDFNTRFAVRADIYSNSGSEARLGQQSAALTPFWDAYPYPKYQHTVENSEEISLISTSLTAAYEQWTVSFITGNKSVDTDWDAFVGEMKNLEIDKYLELVTDSYTKYINR